MNKVDVSYVTTLPLIGNAPMVRVNANPSEEFTIRFRAKNKIIKEVKCNGGEIVYGGRQWYHDWVIEVNDSNGAFVYKDKFNPTGEVVFIKMDAYALGDNIAWIPYVEEFRRKHDCTVICSTFWNNIFANAYPDILFVEPNTNIHNIYAQFYVGAHASDNIYSPIDVNESPLQKVAATQLGLDYKEIVPNLNSQFANYESRVKGKYVCISEHGSASNKEWKCENGWQDVVNYLNNQGYKVLVISKEPTQLKNVIDLTGDIPIEERMIDLLNCDFFMGISSGLSWLAWAMGKHVFLISDCTPTWHEFTRNCTRISENFLTKVDYTIDTHTSSKKVIEKLVEWELSRYL